MHYELNRAAIPDQKTSNLKDVLAAGRRQIYVILRSVIISVVVVGLYIVLASKSYTGISKILLDPRSFSNQDANGDQSGLVLAGTAIDSEVEVIKSFNVLGAVIDKYNLTQDSEFVGSPSLISRLVRRIFRQAPESNADISRLRARAFQTMSSRLVVTRVNKSYVLELDFTSSDKIKAAKLANAIADSFVADQVTSRQQFAERSSGWLEARLVDLRTEALKADLAVQRFREQNNLVLAEGRLVNDQQLGDLNSQLGNARIATYQAEAKFEIIQSIIDRHDLNSAVVESLSNPVIVDLRQKQLIAQKRAADLISILGPKHISVVNLQREASNYEGQIFGELVRIKESDENDLRISRDREKAITDQIARLTGTSAGNNRTLVDLNQLQRESDSYRALYQSFLGKFQDLTQQQSLPTSEVRVVEVAGPPLAPSWPRPIILLPLAVLSGLVTGIGLAMRREIDDKTFRRGDQITAGLNVDFLGIIPIADSDKAQGPFEYVSHFPLSRMANTLRTIRLAVDNLDSPRHPRTVGIVSASSREGKSVVASNFAILAAQDGRKTLLVDADLRRCGMSSEIAPNATKSLADVMSGGCLFSEAVVHTFWENLDILPSIPSQIVPHSSDLLRALDSNEVFTRGFADYDYVVFDLPPLNALVDARAIAPALTAALMVVAWGETSIDSARDALSHNTALRERCVGAVLNKVDMRRISNYQSEATSSYGYSVY